MNISPKQQKFLITILLGILAFGAPGCDWGFLGCKNSSSTSPCGKYNSVELYKTITTADPSYYLETPLASSSSTCPAAFTLTFYFADPYKSEHNGASTKLPINLSHAFQVKATDGAGGYFAQGTEWDIHLQRDSTIFPVIWIVSFSDHNSSTSLSSKYFITFGLNSSDPADSMIIDATIHYHEPN